MKKFLLLLFIALTTSVGAAAQKFALIDMEYI
ncbi:MAG: OmpH family outer membrane protein, partial [Alloprevotella sp.]|nr:OmpH family outer membrane protein [Alloprevotella sp.]